MYINIKNNIVRVLLGMLLPLGAIMIIPVYSVSAREFIQRERDSHTSMGVLVLQSEMIVRGRMGVVSGKWEANVAGVQFGGELVQIEMLRVLYGPIANSNTIEIAFEDRDKVPPRGTEVIVFLSRRVSLEVRGNRWLPIEKADQVYDWGYWKLVGGKRGIIEGSRDRLEYFQGIITEYTGHLKDELDVIAYVEFLSRLSKSTDERVRIDGWWHDWIRLRSWSQWQDQIGRLLADDLLPDMVVERIERMQKRQEQLQRMQNERDRSLMSREDAMAIFEDADYYHAIESGDRMKILRASRAVGRLSRKELIYYSDLWVPHMRELLHSDDQAISSIAASLLSLIGDPSGAPIMIQRLRDMSTSFPAALLRELQRATGQDFPFNPDAPEEVREEQIRRWEKWWEIEGVKLLQEMSQGAEGVERKGSLISPASGVSPDF